MTGLLASTTALLGAAAHNFEEGQLKKHLQAGLDLVMDLSQSIGEEDTRLAKILDSVPACMNDPGGLVEEMGSALKVHKVNLKNATEESSGDEDTFEDEESPDTRYHKTAGLEEAWLSRNVTKNDAILEEALQDLPADIQRRPGFHFTRNSFCPPPMEGLISLDGSTKSVQKAPEEHRFHNTLRAIEPGSTLKPLGIGLDSISTSWRALYHWAVHYAHLEVILVIRERPDLRTVRAHPHLFISNEQSTFLVLRLSDVVRDRPLTEAARLYRDYISAVQAAKLSLSWFGTRGRNNPINCKLILVCPVCDMDLCYISPYLATVGMDVKAHMERHIDWTMDWRQRMETYII